MEALKLHLTIKSDTLKIPELKKFIGRRVEVIFLDEDSKKEKSIIEKFKKFKNLKGKIHFDDNAFNELREKSIL